ncbi:hypothetical protein IWW47_001857, partial [Coemansia sp. RSA 2052]
FVELLVDLESQLATRRYVNLLLIDHQVLELCEASAWHGQQDDMAGTFRSLVALLRERLHFQVSDVSGLALTEAEAKDRHYARVTALQATAFCEFPAQLEALALASVASLASEEALARHLAPLDDAALRRLAACVGIRTRSILPPPATLGSVCGGDGLHTRAFTLRAFGERYAAESEKEGEADSASAYPTEKHVFPAQEQAAQAATCAMAALGYAVLAVPKLGLQFLTLRDYLARSFALLRLESAHDMRESIADAVRRLQPQVGGGFGGWARMALPVQALAMVDVQPPRLGERAPARVRADLSVDLAGYAESVRAEWDAEARPRAVLILAGVVPGGAVRCVRGCEVERRLDDTSNSPVLRLRVLLDAQQFHADATASADDVYAALNVVVRRRPQESSLLAVLGAVRALIAAPEPALLPAWLAPTFLGYAAAHAQPSAAPAGRVYFGDTFVSADHVREVIAGATFDTPFAKPCVVEFCSGGDGVRVVPHPSADMGPPVMIRENAVRFTAAQVAAIGAAAGEGLTLVVGPPGTGKTDVAVQIISNLYHAHPRQTILLLTHSNQALNQLFEKIIAVDIEPRHLLRLGHGEEDLDASERYSKAGRVESFLDRRRELLALVQRLAASLDVPGDFGYTCDTARLFFVAHVRVRWDPYLRRITTPPQPGGVPPVKASDMVADFPFSKFFADEQQQQHGNPVDRLLPKEGDDLPTAVCAAESCFRYIESIFDELADIQPFELLRTNTDRSNYLLTNQARIVAMTCTHAAMKRSELIKLGFRYDSVVMEESAQMLDIESFIPLTLQRSSHQLKRLVMIGDHNQLPPVVKHPDLRSFANLEQSLFTRLVRLGVPYVELNKQARARPEIADLYRFRYRGLGDLSNDSLQSMFAQKRNPGFQHTFQFIDTSPGAGAGGGGGEESEPSRYFYQNLAEAEYIVALYQYMRLLGYPADRIALLTTYNGQLALIRDVLDRRCKYLPFLGLPRSVATVDQYQGQQSDFVLLSLVRTRGVGHLRDLRRLTVALSRSRLGLYVFGCKSLFESCYELQTAMAGLLANGHRLVICPEERFAQEEGEKNPVMRVVEGVEDLGQLVYEMIEAHLPDVDDDE